MNGRRCLCLLGKLWRARSQLAAHEVLAVQREAARNRMVPVGGVRCSHHNGAREDRSGLPRGHARLTGAEPRGTRPPVDLQKRKYGAGGPPWVPYKPQNRAWGTAGATLTEWWLFFPNVSRSGASPGRKEP